jgi:hypothetical protein
MKFLKRLYLTASRTFSGRRHYGVRTRGVTADFDVEIHASRSRIECLISWAW